MSRLTNPQSSTSTRVGPPPSYISLGTTVLSFGLHVMLNNTVIHHYFQAKAAVQEKGENREKQEKKVNET